MCDFVKVGVPNERVSTVGLCSVNLVTRVQLQIVVAGGSAQEQGRLGNAGE